MELNGTNILSDLYFFSFLLFFFFICILIGFRIGGSALQRLTLSSSLFIKGFWNDILASILTHTQLIRLSAVSWCCRVGYVVGGLSCVVGDRRQSFTSFVNSVTPRLIIGLCLQQHFLLLQILREARRQHVFRSRECRSAVSRCQERVGERPSSGKYTEHHCMTAYMQEERGR